MKGFLGSEGMVDGLLALYARTPHPNGIWNVVWSEELNSYLRKVLGNFLLKDQPVADVVNGLSREITRLNEKYGIR
jgi:multiple sugar transport system substrate-binding protein